MSGEAANRSFQRLAHSSTARNAGGLNFRVRDGYGCHPAALAASMPTSGLEPELLSERYLASVEYSTPRPESLILR